MASVADDGQQFYFTAPVSQNEESDAPADAGMLDHEEGLKQLRIMKSNIRNRGQLELDNTQDNTLEITQ